MQHIPNHILTDTLNFFQITDPGIIEIITNVTHPTTIPLTIPQNSNQWDLIQALCHYSTAQNDFNIAENFVFNYLEKHPFIQKLFQF